MEIDPTKMLMHNKRLKTQLMDSLTDQNTKQYD